MRIPDKLAETLNDQVTMELASTITYLQLAAYFDSTDLPGMASWMRVQSAEERAHADRFISHMLDRGAEVRIGAIEAPETDIYSPARAFEAALAQERRVSDSIRRIYRLADELGDIDVIPLLQWFIAEQIEEEASVEEIISRLSRVGDDGAALLILDQELGNRQVSSNA